MSRIFPIKLQKCHSPKKKGLQKNHKEFQYYTIPIYVHVQTRNLLEAFRLCKRGYIGRVLDKELVLANWESAPAPG